MQVESSWLDGGVRRLSPGNHTASPAESQVLTLWGYQVTQSTVVRGQQRGPGRGQLSFTP